MIGGGSRFVHHVALVNPGARGLMTVDMRKPIAIAVLASFALSASVPGARAQSGQDPFNGTWKLNTSKSTAKWQSHAQPKIAEPQAQAWNHGVYRQDIDVFEAIQSSLHDLGSRSCPNLSVRADEISMRGRRVLEKMLMSEKGMTRQRGGASTPTNP